MAFAQKFDPRKQVLAERKWLEKHRPYDKIEGANPADPKSVGIIPIPQSVYEPAGGLKKIRQGLLRDD